MSKIIELTQGRVAIVDDEDFDLISRWKWCFDSGTGYAVRGVWLDGRTVKTYMHRVITGARKGRVVDHANHDKLDNRRCNLSVGTQADNMINQAQTIREGYSSKYRGVHLYTPTRWAGTYRGRYLGVFADEMEAAKSYDLAALRDQGPSAQLNFPIAGLELL